VRALASLWPALEGRAVRVLEGGLINRSYRVGDPPVAALQRLHPVFEPAVNRDIAAITAHLAGRGMPTPRLLTTGAGDLFHLDEEGGCWRALSWVAGRTFHKLTDPRLAVEAGRLVGRWHAACDDLDHEFAFSRPGAHDTDAHMAKLAAALDDWPDHRLREAVAPLAEEVLGAWARWSGRRDLPPRIAHGDLKISNLRFDGVGRGICLLDLDTMAWLPLDVELGDAWRSWCNPATEDTPARFDLELFAASARGYLSARPIAPDVLEALPAGVERICLELTGRFAADALEESYFGWSEAVAPTRGDHNLLRARGQLELARAVSAARGEMVDILAAQSLRAPRP